jgi:hypothetical protein
MEDSIGYDCTDTLSLLALFTKFFYIYFLNHLGSLKEKQNFSSASMETDGK